MGEEFEDKSEELDKQVLDESDFLNDKDLNINPQQYIHMALQRSQVALLNPNLEAGLIQYVFLVQQIELIAFSAKLIDQAEYKKELDAFKLKEEFTKAKYQNMVLAQEKLKLLLKEVFDNKTSNTPLKL